MAVLNPHILFKKVGKIFQTCFYLELNRSFGRNLQPKKARKFQRKKLTHRYSSTAHCSSLSSLPASDTKREARYEEMQSLYIAWHKKGD